MSQGVAPDFEGALVDLQHNLPRWWQSENPSSTLHGILSAVASTLDELAWDFEQPFLDQSIRGASLEGLLRNFASAWGVENELLPPTLEALRAYVEARTEQSGSVESLITTLMALIEIPANTTGGSIETFNYAVVNGVANPSFETNTEHWIAAGGTIATSTEQAEFGTHSLAFTKTGGTGVAEISIGISAIALGTPYTASAYLRPKTTARNWRVGIQWRNAAEEPLATSYGSYTEAQASTWTRISVTASAPAAAVSARTIVSSEATVLLNEVHFLDGAMFCQGALIAYLDGSSTECRWSGAANESTTEAGVLFFPVGGQGLPLFEFELGKGPRGALLFPANGEGLHFPVLPEVIASEEYVQGATGQTPPGAGSGLIFAQNGYIAILQNTPGAYEWEVQVVSWATFNRQTFARAVERFRPAHCLPARIREISQTEV